MTDHSRAPGHAPAAATHPTARPGQAHHAHAAAAPVDGEPAEAATGGTHVHAHAHTHAHAHAAPPEARPVGEPGRDAVAGQAARGGAAGHAGHADHTAEGHGGHVGHTAELFTRPLLVSLVLTVPVVLYSDLFHEILGIMPPAFPGSWLIGPVLGSVIYWYSGWVFLAGARDELRARQPSMMTLVALAISTAYFYSLAISVGLVGGMPFYWELATLVSIMLLGHWLELRAVGSARSALRELAKLLPDTAERVVGDRTEMVPVSELRPGDLVLVRSGSRVPTDGRVEAGRSEVDESMLTGESRPVAKEPGSSVIGGTVNGSGSLRVRITQTGEGSVLAGIMRLVEEAQTSRTRAQALADRVAYWLTLVAVGVALAALVGWTVARGLDAYTIERVVTTLVVACPHALGLAIPLVIAISTTLAARNGILVRDRLALETARNLDVVVFDKTGTLTRGEQGLVAVVAADGRTEAEVLALAAAVERDSEHPLARAILAAARERGLTVPEAAGFGALPGRGVRAVVDGRDLAVGGPRLLDEAGITLPDDLAAQAALWGERGQSVVYLVEGDRVLGALALADVIRPESREAVAALQAAGIRVAMLTGDSQAVADWVAGELGITEVFAQVLPEDKSARVRELQRNGARVAMVGDGVNDAPALAQADVGIAIGAGTDVAVASAGIVLVRNDPRDVVAVIELSRASYRKMVQNLVWAVGYNAFALPLAAGVLAPFGLVLPMAVGAALMSLSTIIVALNAQTLRRLRLRPADGARAAAPVGQPA